MSGKEKKVVALVLVMLGLWIASSWVPQINVMVVAILGCCVLFLPGVRVLDIETFLRENSWDAFFLVGTVLSISNAMINNGVSDFIADLIPAMDVSTMMLIAFTAVLIFAALIVIPVASSLIPIMAVPLVAIAVNAGVSSALVLMTAALCAGNCYLLPLDTVTLITYSKGYYSMTDMAKSTIFMQIAIDDCFCRWRRCCFEPAFRCMSAEYQRVIFLCDKIRSGKMKKSSGSKCFLKRLFEHNTKKANDTKMHEFECSWLNERITRIGYIVTVDDGLGSFICPHCGKEIIFLADEKHMGYGSQ